MTESTRRTARRMLAALLVVAACGADPKPAPDAEGEPHADEHAAEANAGVVTLNETARRTAGITTALAEAGRHDGDEITAPGRVESDPAHTVYLSARAPGRLERLLAVVGDRVTAGAVVAEVQSGDYLAVQGELRQAAARARVLRGTADAAGAEALTSAARERVARFGVDAAELARLEGGGAPRPLLAVTAPFAGSIVEGLTLAGAAVEAGTPIFRLIDLRQIDVAAAVPEERVPGLRIGQTARIIVAAYPDLRITGRVERIRDELDPETRTIDAIIHVDNPALTLRPGMFATVHLAGRGGATVDSGVVRIPAAALLNDGDGRIVFVETMAGTWERRAVEVVGTLPALGGGAAMVTVRGRLRPGDRVVVTGGFILKSELAKAGLGEDH